MLINKKGAVIYSPFCLSGDKGSRTLDLLGAIQTLYQLSYIPKVLNPTEINFLKIIVCKIIYIIL